MGRNMSGGCPTSPSPWAVRSGVGKGLMTIADTPAGYAAEIASTVGAQSRGGLVTIAQLSSADAPPPLPAHQPGPSAKSPRAAVVRARAHETWGQHGLGASIEMHPLSRRAPVRSDSARSVDSAAGFVPGSHLDVVLDAHLRARVGTHV